ncbi:MAG: flagellar biosynthetic protein FliO [Sulfuritalea sp.]|nr:flagellar biosynthetic protein FliO [Sulfuritalea sp.]
MVRFIPTPLLLLATTEAAAQATQAASVADPGGSLWQLFLALGIVLALVIGSLWVLKKLLAPRGESAGLMRVVAGTAVGTRERVVIVEVGGTWLVLGWRPVVSRRSPKFLARPSPASQPVRPPRPAKDSLTGCAS